MICVIRYELLRFWQGQQQWLQPLLFLGVVATLFPISLSHSSAPLASFAPAILWCCLLLAILWGIESLYRSDMETGYFEQLVFLHAHTWQLHLGRCISHWIGLCLPMLLLSPVLALLYQMPFNQIGIMFVTMLIGTPFLICLGSVIASLTLAMPKGQLLMAILLIPLNLPMLLFALGAMEGESQIFELCLLAALSVAALTICPFILDKSVRLSIEEG